jgi:hypothetical protein
MVALIGVITALVGGSTIGVVLAGLSIADWISIAGVLLAAGEDAVKLFVALHPALVQIEADLRAKVSAQEIAHKAVKLPFHKPAAAPPKPAGAPPSYNDPSKFGGSTAL